MAIDISAAYAAARHRHPTIVLGHPAMSLVQEPAVYIPVGVPGVDHAGHICRSDGVAALPLRRLRETQLPSAAQILSKLTERLS